MRLVPLVLIFGFAYCEAPAARAGLYNTAEPDEGPLDPNFIGKFRGTLITLQTIGAPKVEVERPLRKRYILQADLFGKLDAGKLTPEEKLNFSAALIRRRRVADAIQLLIPATRQYPEMFLLQSNLATAFQLNGDKNRARDTMKDCLDAWPKEWHELTEPQRDFLASIGWNEGPFGFYREAENYYVKLLRLRSREPKELEGQIESVDALFDVKFVAESGEFEPGKINRADKAKLPRNALDLIEQLLVWTPDDLRLYWLLGEVLNAQGDAKAARAIFDNLVYDHKLRAKDLMARRQTLNSWVEPATGQSLEDDDNKPKETPPPAVDWRGLLVAFGAGIVVAIFGHWQIREIRRRRQRT